MRKPNPADESDEAIAGAVASAVEFLLSLSNHSGTVVRRSDGAAVFVLRDGEIAEKFLDFYKTVFADIETEDDLVAAIEILREVANEEGDGVLDSDGDLDGDRDSEIDPGSN